MAIAKPYRLPGHAASFAPQLAAPAADGQPIASSSSTISTAVTTTVTLGSGSYGDKLTVTASGSVAPTASGADGIVAPASQSGVQIVNRGSIAGGVGQNGQTGGIGVDMLSAGLLHNFGSITGGNGSYANSVGSAGGAGAYIAGGHLINSGTISGGNGASSGAHSGAGGDGVQIAAATVFSNTGTIAGGSGGYDFVGPATSGGAGVDLLARTTMTNTGTIRGGAGGNTGDNVGGAGGVGIEFANGGTLTNSGTIIGGQSGRSAFAEYASPQSAAGVVFAASGKLVNTGAITGGRGAMFGRDGGSSGGGDGADMAAGSAVTNKGLIAGGQGGYGHPYAGNGGRGVDLSGGMLSNGGTIEGGAGGWAIGGQYYQEGISGTGGTGLEAANAAVKNTGLIEGGAGGTTETNAKGEGNGGIGVDFSSAGSLINNGTILGGAGGAALYEIGPGGEIAGVGGTGGTGAQLASGVNASNHGTIIGGAGGYVQDSISTAGAGGAGVDVISGGGTLTNAGFISGGTGGAAFAVTGPATGVGGAGGNGVDLFGGVMKNTGTITGGAGGYGVYQGGAGGVGVYINGGTMVSSGTISGGAGGHGGTTDGAAGVAVQFGAAASTLIIDPGAKFEGAIVANSAARDTLVLGGTADGQLSGFGTSITGFSTIDEAAHAHWVLTGNMTGVTALAIGTGASLQLTGAVNAGDIIFSRGGHETLKLDAPGQVNTVIAGFSAGDVIDLANLHVSAMSFLHGTLTLMDGASTVDTLRFAGGLTAADFVMHADGAGGTDITLAQAAEPAWHGGWTPQELRWDIFSWQHR